jgi:hypothetical protein
MPVKIEKELIDEYGAICIALRTYRKEKDEIRPLLIENLAAGCTLPEGDLYRIEPVPFVRAQVDWAREAVLLAQAVYGERWKDWESQVVTAAPRVCGYRLMIYNARKKKRSAA